MKKIFFMRHGKAEKNAASGTDFDRNLEVRGQEDAREMAKTLHKSNNIPQYIVSSPANRTLQTAKKVANELKIQPKQFELDSNLYMAGLDQLIHVVRNLNDSWDTAMIVGHNPSITGIVGYLTHNFIEHVPTAGIVIVEFNEPTWKLIRPHHGTLLWSGSPKGSPIV